MTTIINKYRIFCSTDNVWRYVWSNTPPTTCPDNVGHSVNSNSVSSVQIALSKLITSTDSPYYQRDEYLECDTSSGVIDVRLTEANQSENAIVRLIRTNGGNDVNIYNNNDVSSLFTINTTDEILILRSNGTTWQSISVNSEDSSVDNYEELVSSIVNDRFTPTVHNKGDLISGDGRNRAIFPVGSNDQVLISDSSTSVGLRWGSLLASLQHDIITLTSSWSTTSTSFTTVNGMTSTPVSGTYLIIFSGNLSSTNSITRPQYTIYNNSSEISHTRRDYQPLSFSFNSTNRTSAYTHTIISLNGSDTISIRARRVVSSGSISFDERSLILIKLS